MYNPVSTYRIQFHSGFTFSDLQAALPYLHRLGIGTLYASPIFEATPGSVHGYDGVNPNAVNPEIGTEEQMRALSAELHRCGIGWLQDIVPNHMAFHSNNEWFMDVLEKGRRSEFASFFDVSWTGRLYHGKIMVPFLGATLADTLQNGELSVAVHDGRLVLAYYDSTYPLRPASYATVLQYAGVGDQALLAQLGRIEDDAGDEADFAERWLQLRSACTMLIERAAARTNAHPLDAVNRNPDLLGRIVDEQFYRLCHWQETDRTINFRRFFTVNSLICLNIHRPEVFREYHRLVRELVEDGVIHGLRIDHIDGLYDPTDYLQQLRALVGEEPYIAVEKILEPGERLPELWPVQGTTGYDFLAMVNNLLTSADSEPVFTELYRELTGDDTSIHDHLHEKKAYILYHHMGGELDNLYQLFMHSELFDTQEYAQGQAGDIKTALAEFLICCPVYRYYGDRMPLPEEEAAQVREVCARILARRKDLAEAVHLLEHVLLEKPHTGSALYRMRVLRLYQRCMQFTGPLMAKGVEDTLMYTYNRFIGHNDVGDSPESFGCTMEQFHAMMQERRCLWPLAMNATSTHDTKRGEDVRARLNVLSDLPEEWRVHVHQWRTMNAGLKRNNAPDANDEYFLYQTLLGAWPMPGTDDDFPARLHQYIEKALREAKTHSDWSAPDTDYEDAVKHFVNALLDPQHPFLESFSGFYREVVEGGIVNALAQLILRYTCPGVPDTYQGTELWDLSLVDPDNRRPVDYAHRRQILENVLGTRSVAEVWEDRYSGAIKLLCVHRLMRLRREHPDLCTVGEYVPLSVQGQYSGNVCAFARRHNNSVLLVAVPLHLARLCREQRRDVLSVDWGDTRVAVPEELQFAGRDILTNRDMQCNTVAIAELFGSLPCAVLLNS